MDSAPDKVMLSNDFLRGYRQSMNEKNRSVKRASVKRMRVRVPVMLPRPPLCIRRINNKRKTSSIDKSLVSLHVTRRLLLNFDSSLHDKSLTMFNDEKLTIKISSLLSKKKRSKDAIFVSNGILISQQRGPFHAINNTISDPKVTFKFSPCTSLVKAIFNREIGSNFRCCTNPKPAFLHRYKNAPVFFNDLIFEQLRTHPYRQRLYTGPYIISHLQSEKKKKKITSILGRFHGNLSQVAKFWWSHPFINFKS